MRLLLTPFPYVGILHRHNLSGEELFADCVRTRRWRRRRKRRRRRRREVQQEWRFRFKEDEKGGQLSPAPKKMLFG